MNSKIKPQQDTAYECSKSGSPNVDGSWQDLAFPQSLEMLACLTRMEQGIRRATQDEAFRKEIAKRAS